MHSPERSRQALVCVSYPFHNYPVFPICACPSRDLVLSIARDPSTREQQHLRDIRNLRILPRPAIILESLRDAGQYDIRRRCGDTHSYTDVPLALSQPQTVTPEAYSAHFLSRGPRAHSPLSSLRVFPHSRGAAGVHVAMGASTALGARKGGRDTVCTTPTVGRMHQHTARARGR